MARTRKVTVSTDVHGHTAGWAGRDTGARPRTGRPRRAAAFFDVDNTMMQGASIYWFARGLAARNYFTTGDLARFAWQQLRFRVLATEHAGDMSQAKEAALAFVQGWRVDDVERLAEEIFDELMAPRIWAGTRRLAQRHLDAGQRVWLVSAAPVEIGRVIAARLGLTGAIGTVAEVVDGAYTGRLVGDLMHGPAKAEAVAQLAAVEGLDLARCAAYSDSAQRPADALRGRAGRWRSTRTARCCGPARQRGWEVRDFRTGRRAARIAVPSTAAPGCWPARSPPAWRCTDAAAPPDRRLAAARPGPPRRRLTAGRRHRRVDAASGSAPGQGRPGGRSGAERVGAAFQQLVQGLLDGLADLVGEVEHDQRVVAPSRSGGRSGSAGRTRSATCSAAAPCPAARASGNVGVTGK